MQRLTHQRLLEVLHYDHATGVFRWRVSTAQRVKVGDVAGRIDSKGYRCIRTGGRDYRAGRLVWFYVHGCWPKDQIDHRNGTKDDDRLDNLRDVAPSENMQNRRRARRDNKTGLLGVSQSQRNFRARIRVNGVRHHLGMFATAAAAHTAYLAAKRRIHPTCTI